MGVGGLFASIRNKITSVVDCIVPVVGDEDIEEDSEALISEKVVSSSRVVTRSTEQRMVANGSTIGHVTTPNFGNSVQAIQETATTKSEPQLTVHTTKVPEMKVKIHIPNKFDHVSAIADHLKSNIAVVVNFEGMNPPEQRRVCDFVNGTCYVLGGSAKQVSSNIMLYVPRGVDFNQVLSIALVN